MIEQLTDISSFDWKKVGKTRDDGGNLPANENPSVSLDNQDIDGHHKKFGGNKSLRGDINLGFDQRFINKEIGDIYDSLGFDDGISQERVRQILNRTEMRMSHSSPNRDSESVRNSINGIREYYSNMEN